MSQFNIVKAGERSSHANAWTILVQKAMLGEEVTVAHNDKALLKLELQPEVKQSFAATATGVRALLVRLDGLLQAQGSNSGGDAVDREFHVICDNPMFRKLGVQRPVAGFSGIATPSVGQVWPW